MKKVISRQKRTVTNQIIEDKDKDKSNLKVIAFKITVEQLDFIKKSNDKRISTSISEFCRIGIYDLLHLMINERITIMKMGDLLIRANKTQSDNKESVCAKIPVNFLKIIDKIQKKFQDIFSNRTNLIRASIQLAIEDQEDMIEYYKNSFGLEID
jgi:hypothetical protein